MRLQWLPPLPRRSSFLGVLASLLLFLSACEESETQNDRRTPVEPPGSPASADENLERLVDELNSSEAGQALYYDLQTASQALFGATARRVAFVAGPVEAEEYQSLRARSCEARTGMTEACLTFTTLATALALSHDHPAYVVDVDLISSEGPRDLDGGPCPPPPPLLPPDSSAITELLLEVGHVLPSDLPHIDGGPLSLKGGVDMYEGGGTFQVDGSSLVMELRDGGSDMECDPDEERLGRIRYLMDVLR